MLVIWSSALSFLYVWAQLLESRITSFSSAHTHINFYDTSYTIRMMSQVKQRGGLLSVVVVLLLTIGGAEASIAPLASKPTLLVSKSTSLSTLSTEATSDGDTIDDAVVTINETVVPRCGGDDEVTPLAHRLKVGGYFAIWYILNIIYNSKCSPPKLLHLLDFFNVFVHYMQTNTKYAWSTLF